MKKAFTRAKPGVRRERGLEECGIKEKTLRGLSRKNETTLHQR